jgi:adenine-specific DNA-methyltransferase
MDDFLNKICEIHDILLNSKDSIYKINIIDECKAFLGIQKKDSLGSYYYSVSGVNKNTGTVYTPIDIAEYMIENTINEEDVINNPFLRIVDPSCGIGNIIIPCFTYLKRVFLNNLEEINNLNSINLKEEEIDFHIVNNNLFGIDIEPMVLKILQIDLFAISNCINEENFLQEDFLLYEQKKKYDVYIGNPPYIGHKSIEKEYRKKITTKYSAVYSDKGDLAYCFFYKAIKSLQKAGKVSFITSRYFMEALSGEGLRTFILESCSINKIIDFYGIRPFKAAGIDPVIIFLEVNSKEKDKIQVIKGKNIKVKSQNRTEENILGVLEKDNFYKFVINKKHLGSDPWIIIDEDKRRILEKLRNVSEISLGEICESYQGIISGCDKAFVIDNETAKVLGIEKELLKPWIKSSNINKEEVKETKESIIYSNMIEDEGNYPNSIKYIGMYKERLIKRRECCNGIRKWYELQWGRKSNVFEDLKIIFPYKASSNRFALDTNSYFSADVYAIKIKNNCDVSYNFLIKLLNSKIYEFYFKTFAKKLGGNLYEYYPNNLMRLKVPLIYTDENIDDTYLYNYFNIDEHEKNIIEDSIK